MTAIMDIFPNFLILFRMREWLGRGQAKRPSCSCCPVTSANVGISPQKLSEFQFYSFCGNCVKFQGHTQCQFQIIEFGPRPFLKKSIFASIIKTATIFIKTILKDSEKVKIIGNYVPKCNLYLQFLIQQNLLISGKKMLMSAEHKGYVT